MLNTWFTSDTHFGHAKILEFESEKRPFVSLDEMHEVLITRWNEVVKPKDTVWHLGDFCFGRQNIAIAARLNGVINLIMGNHDHYPIQAYMPHFNKIMGAFCWRNCILTHIPVHPQNLGEHFRSYGIDVKKILNVHGHLHSNNIQQAVFNQGKIINKIYDENYFNVSVEQNNLYPFHADQILQRLRIL